MHFHNKSEGMILINDMSNHQPIVKYINGQFQKMNDVIVEEFPLTIYVNQTEFATLVCSPTHMEELIVGFLASEGIVIAEKEIESLEIDIHKGVSYVTLKNKTNPVTLSAKRVFGSCCGKSRKFYFQNDIKTAKTALSTITITPEQCLTLMNTLQRQSDTFQKTGGVHNAALATPEGILLQRSDIGRHNAIDKLYGHA